MEKQGATPEQAAENFWVLDNRGLITCARQDLPPHVAPFARPCGDQEGRGLLGTIRKVSPGCGGRVGGGWGGAGGVGQVYVAAELEHGKHTGLVMCVRRGAWAVVCCTCRPP